MPDFVFSAIVGLIGAILGAIIQGVLPNSSKKLKDFLLPASIGAAIALIIGLLLTSILTASTNSSATGQSSSHSFDLGLIFNCVCISGLILFLMAAISGIAKTWTNTPSSTSNNWDKAYETAKGSLRKMREIPLTHTISITDNGIESNGVRTVTFRIDKFELSSSPVLNSWADRDRHEGIFKVKIDLQGNILNYEPK